MSNLVERSVMMVPVRKNAGFADVYSGRGGTDFYILQGQLMRRAGRKSKTVGIFMHPTAALHALTFPPALTEAGIDVIIANSRYFGNDSALLMENVLIDLGAFIRSAREDYGYEKVVLIGWSGGGALMCYYQSQAEAPSVEQTPAGDPLSMKEAGLIPGDGIAVIAAHRSRHSALTDWMDASVLDELNPEKRDRELDLYDPNNPNQPPYSAVFLERYRSKQKARNRRITAWVKDTLEHLRSAGDDEAERAFVVHRTMADPKWLDPTIDANDRRPGWCYLGDPRIVNTSPAGFARFCTLRGWLSQWSLDDALCDGPIQLARTSVPFMIIENTADEVCPRSDTLAYFEASRREDKEMLRIPGATHYYAGQPELLAEAIRFTRRWLEKHNLVSA